jgi:hypothetical protein
MPCNHLWGIHDAFAVPRARKSKPIESLYMAMYFWQWTDNVHLAMNVDAAICNLLQNFNMTHRFLNFWSISNPQICCKV